MPSGVGSTHKACVNWRSANSSNRPTNGRMVGPKIEVAISQIPSTSITAELAMSSASAARMDVQVLVDRPCEVE